MTHPRQHIKSKEYIYNYVDRVRFAESSFPDYKYPSRGSGWRHNKSISHLDLATSCHSAASGLNHWPSSGSHQSSRHQLRHSRSLDYNHIDRCKDALDIAEYYWRLDHEPEIYDEEEEIEFEPEHKGSQLKYVSEHHYRDFKCADDNYHHSANNIYQTSTPQQQQQQQQQQQPPPQKSSNSRQSKAVVTANSGVALQALEFASDSCSLRRSRSLAVIREETFSDLQISSSNGSRRSQLIPRARLVNRGYFRERDRLIYSNNKPQQQQQQQQQQHQVQQQAHHHHHHTSREKLTNCSGGGSVNGSIAGGAVSSAPSVDVDAEEQSNESVAETCESHQQQLKHYNQQQQQQQKSHSHYHQHYHETVQPQQQQHAVSAASVANDYYDHLKRLDKLALGLVAEQLHPWHNDKSDLESLNSDYFKNSLHQSHELKPQQQHHHQYEIEALEQAVNLLTQDKPRIYQSRRQKRHSVDNVHKLTHSAAASGGESCPENSQSSVFPETTTSNSDDQSDSGSLSEQEYDITKIEEIYQKTRIEGDADSYEIISLTTTTRTRFESTGDECENEDHTHHRHLDECDYTRDQHEYSDHIEEGEEAEDSNQHTTTDTEVEGTLKRSRAVSENLQKIIAYDSVYLSSEESSDSTLVDPDTSLEVTSLRTCIDEVETVLHISIEDAVYEPKAKLNKLDIELECGNEGPIGFVETVNTKIEILEQDSCEELEPEEVTPVYTQILKVEHTPSAINPNTVITTAPVGVTSSAASKPKILSVVEKRKLKRYSDSAYSSNVSDSSERTYGSYPSNESTAFSHHLKRQVAEPLYIPLKSNLGDNQYHSLPDVNIGQILRVSETIDAQLRSCYNFDNYRSLDNSAVLESHVNESSIAASNDLLTKDVRCLSRRQKREDTITTEDIYDSIKRFGRAHQRYRQKESQQQQQKQQQQQQRQEHQQSKDNINTTNGDNIEVEEKEVQSKDLKQNSGIQKGKAEIKIQEDKIDTPDNSTQTKITTYPTTKIEENNTEPTSLECHLEASQPTTLNDPYDSFEKPKEAPQITIENFSQQIERRAKEIRQSGRRNKQQQIEFANRAKFRLENTLTSYKENEETVNRATTHQSKTTTLPSAPPPPPAPPFRIVVTDAHNNIIEEDSIESRENYTILRNSSPDQENPKQVQEPDEEEKENFNSVNVRRTRKEESQNDLQVIKLNKERSNSRQSSLRRAPSKPKRQQYPTHVAHLNGNDTKKSLVSSPKSKERRVLSNQIYRARPVKVITTTDSFRRSKVKQTASKMSRPQILQVIDNKRKSHDNGNPTTVTTNHNDGNHVEEEYLKKVDAVRCYWSKLVNEEEQPNHQVEKLEQQSPKDSGHSEDATKETAKPQIVSTEREKENCQINNNDTSTPAMQPPEKRHFILGAQSTTNPSVTPVNGTTKQHTNAAGQDHPATKHNPDDYCSFMPSIEIVELDGDKKATIVSAVPANATADDTLDATEPQFDHIRYKVMKSQQLLRSNLLARNTKEAQFDGLIQYLQEYSFQELLSNNNVVIVEPVRTKIERPLGTASTSSSCLGFGKNAKDKRTNGDGKQQPEAGSAGIVGEIDESRCRKQRTNSTSSSTASTGGGGGGGIKRHFFYQPVRVNRELYEEELPNPDTVRNVRKFFEEHILPTPGQGLLTTAAVAVSTTATGTATITTTTTTATLTKTTHKNSGNGISGKQASPKSRRTRKYRYLTIDTSYGHAAGGNTTAKLQQRRQQEEKNNNNARQSRKWDTASLSSGVSSGDLSSPCECNETTDAKADDGNTNSSSNEKFEGVHVQDIVKQHNGVSGKKSRVSATGIPVRSSSVRTRSAIAGSAAYASLHKKSNKQSMYRNIYEYHAIHRQQQHPDSDDQTTASAADEGNDADDDDDLFGDIDDDGNELCDTYYVSNDVLRKIRECGSSVTYYGGRVVQTNSYSAPPNVGKTLADCGKPTSTNPIVPTTKPKHNQTTMLAQTQTRARVREIETCSNAVCQASNECLSNNRSTNNNNNNGKNTNNGCSNGNNGNSNNNNNNSLPQQTKIHLTRDDNPQNKDSKSSQLQSPPSSHRQGQANDTMASDSSDNANRNNSYVEGSGISGGGVTFKLVKSNSCSSRLELAGTDVDIIEQGEETEVVRKMVHHFEASTKSKPTTAATDVPVTINNQAPLCLDGPKLGTESKPVTVNNHISIGVGILSPSTNDEASCGQENGSKEDEPKTYQSEAKDIHLDKSAHTAVAGNAATNEMGGTLNGKVCRNRNVDLAFTFVKQQQQQPNQQSAKSMGIKENENGKKNHKQTNGDKTHTSTNISQNLAISLESAKGKEAGPVMSKAKDSCKWPTGNFRSDVDNNSNTTYAPPEQIIVPVEIHRESNEHFPLTKNSPHSHKTADTERSFLPLSTTSSVTSVIDKSVVKHYVANDRSIYEKRKYDDIEFEEFEVYDPTKDFEKLIQEEEAKRQCENNSSTAGNVESQQSSNTSSMRTAKSQQTTVNGSTETETDCYDSLDDKL
ncbi:protein javelin [Musca vetustissima]|uniref:protein javelin n=1 Tax=Musca vetustissima TaxID=27455 RepID=UPI002AB7E5DE|nr:protein javelin [Musca vetustissima]